MPFLELFLPLLHHSHESHMTAWKSDCVALSSIFMVIIALQFM